MTEYEKAGFLEYMNKKAFTLIELMAVIMIIAILSAMVLGLGRYAMQLTLRSRAKAGVQHLHGAAGEYKMDTHVGGGYPTIDGVEATGFLTNSTEITRWLPETFSFIDPWGNPYQYIRISAHRIRVYSFGADGTNATPDDIESSGR